MSLQETEETQGRRPWEDSGRDRGDVVTGRARSWMRQEGPSLDPWEHADLGPALVTGHWLWRGNTDSLPPLGGSLCRAPALPLTRHSPRPHWIHTSAAVSLPLRSPRALGSFTFVLLLPLKWHPGERSQARHGGLTDRGFILPAPCMVPAAGPGMRSPPAPCT